MEVSQNLSFLESDIESKSHRNLPIKELIIVLIFVSIIAMTVVAVKQNSPTVIATNQASNLGFERAIVTQVIDGETFETESGEKVRLICVDAPEKGKSLAAEAQFYLSKLVLNKSILMERDISNYDENKTLLRYVYVQSKDNKDYAFVNKEIVSRGLAKVVRYGKNIKYCDLVEGKTKEVSPKSA